VEDSQAPAQFSAPPQLARWSIRASVHSRSSSACRHRTPSQNYEMDFQRAVLFYLWATPIVGMEGSGYFQARRGKVIAVNPPPPVQSFSRCSTQLPPDPRKISLVAAIPRKSLRTEELHEGHSKR
jgi:hypothetical protein